MIVGITSLPNHVWKIWEPSLADIWGLASPGVEKVQTRVLDAHPADPSLISAVSYTIFWYSQDNRPGDILPQKITPEVNLKTGINP